MQHPINDHLLNFITDTAQKAANVWWETALEGALDMVDDTMGATDHPEEFPEPAKMEWENLRKHLAPKLVTQYWPHFLAALEERLLDIQANRS